MKKHCPRFAISPLLAALLAGTSGNVLAVDGVVLIDQARVLASGGFPFKISQSGSYRLAGNLSVPDANTTAIRITADNVTLDLNGFSIVGPTRCVSDSSGMVVSCSPAGSGRGIEGGSVILNGTVMGMGDVGVRPSGSSTSVVEHVIATMNGRGGIECSGRCEIRYASAISNNAIGIDLNSGGTADGVVAEGNASYGIYATSYSLITRSRSIRNGDAGIFSQGLISVTGTIASSNGSTGISVGGDSTVIGNLVFDNGSRGSGGGIRETGGVGGSVIQNNVVSANGGGAGIEASHGSQLLGNTVTGNGGFGLKMHPATAFGGNVVRDNAQSGQISGGISIGPNVCQNALCP